MRKILAGLVLMVCLSSAAFSALTESAVIYSHNSGSVHLRTERSTKSVSKGLYFPGTQVLCEDDPVGEWAHVVIGSEDGYMKREFLLQGALADTVITEKQGTVKKQGAILRQEPSDFAREMMTLKGGTILMILGETKDRWYYVQTGDERGYVHKDYVTNRKVKEGVFPFAAETVWRFSSGAGAWRTELIVQPNGTFEGNYHDWEAGSDGPNYPYGTRYECSFSGKFEIEGKIANRVYAAKVVSLNLEQKPGTITYVDGVREITAEAYGVSKGNRFYLCLTGANMEWLTEDMRIWVQDNISDGQIVAPVLLNRDEDWGFCLQ